MLRFSANPAPKIWREGRCEMGSTVSTLPPQTPLSATSVIVLFDGRLLNAVELRKTLLDKDPTLRLEHPEEIIAALYTFFGEIAFSHLSGPFAIALFDPKNQELLLARDLLGEKPLYWTCQNHFLLFASSLKSLLASQLIPQTPDLEALSYYFTFGFIPQEKSPIHHVYKLQPGHYLRYTKDENLFIRPYWTLGALLKNKQTSADAKEYATLVQSVWKRQQSSSDAALYCHHEEEKSTLSPFFPSLITPSSTQGETTVQDLDELLFAMDEPIADLHIPQLFTACKTLHAQNKKELLLTTGSPHFLRREMQLPRLPQFPNLLKFKRHMMKQLLVPLLSALHSKETYEMLRSLHTHPWHVAFLHQSILFDKKEIHELHSQQIKPVDIELFLHRFPVLEKLGPTLSSLIYLYFKTKLPSVYLHAQERFGSYFGIDMKNPFLDPSLIHYLAQIPDTGRAFSLERLIWPPQATPFARIGALPSWSSHLTLAHLGDRMHKSVLVEAGLLSSHWLKEQMKNFNKHPHLVYQELWGILVLEGWFRLYIERSPREFTYRT